MSLILGKAFNQHSPRGAEALLLCQEELISVLIRRSLLSLNITLGTSPAILSQITQLSSFSAFHPRSPPSSSPTSLNSFPPPFFRLIFQSTINSLLITEVMEVVLPLLAPLLSFLCQYFWLQRPDPFRCWGNMLRPWWVCFVFVLGATSLSSASSSFYCSQWCLCDIWTNFSLATSLCFYSPFTPKISPQPSTASPTSSPLPHKCFPATNMHTNVFFQPHSLIYFFPFLHCCHHFYSATYMLLNLLP